VFIGHNVTFINDRYPRSVNKDGKLKKEKDWVLEKTVVDKGASIGSGCIIMCGIKIGMNSTVGAGSLVLKDIPNNKIFFNRRKVYLKK
jgi:acetyltransferase-like isoleucine patch superfamily enzyme